MTVITRAIVMKIFLIFLSLIVVSSTKAIKSSTSVIELTDKSFKDEIAPGKGQIFLRFFASW